MKVTVGSILSCVCLLMGYGLDIGFSEHFNTGLVTTLHYGAIADLHTSQSTTAHAKSFQSAVFSPVVAWSRLSAVDIPLALGSRNVPGPS
jgi:hypothetical protein